MRGKLVLLLAASSIAACKDSVVSIGFHHEVVVWDRRSATYATRARRASNIPSNAALGAGTGGGRRPAMMHSVLPVRTPSVERRTGIVNWSATTGRDATRGTWLVIVIFVEVTVGVVVGVSLLVGCKLVPLVRTVGNIGGVSASSWGLASVGGDARRFVALELGGGRAHVMTENTPSALTGSGAGVSR